MPCGTGVQPIPRLFSVASVTGATAQARAGAGLSNGKGGGLDTRPHVQVYSDARGPSHARARSRMKALNDLR